MDTSSQSQLAVPQSQPRILSQEEKNDLRKRVLAGQSLTVEEARDVVNTLRAQRGVAVAASQEKAARKGGKKGGMSDEDLDASLGSLGL